MNNTNDEISIEVIKILDLIRDNFTIERKDGKSAWIYIHDNNRPYSYEDSSHVLFAARQVQILNDKDNAKHKITNKLS